MNTLVVYSNEANECTWFRNDNSFLQKILVPSPSMIDKQLFDIFGLYPCISHLLGRVWLWFTQITGSIYFRLVDWIDDSVTQGNHHLGHFAVPFIPGKRPYFAYVYTKTTVDTRTSCCQKIKNNWKGEFQWKIKSQPRDKPMHNVMPKLILAHSGFSAEQSQQRSFPATAKMSDKILSLLLSLI